jgi:hypothetical protein
MCREQLVKDRAVSSCPSIVPELSPSSVYSRRFPSSGPSRKSLSFLVWPTRSDDGLRWVLRSNPVGDADSGVTAQEVAGAGARIPARIVTLLSRESRWGPPSLGLLVDPEPTIPRP